MDVLNHHHSYESRIAAVMVEGEPTELVECRNRLKVIQFQVALAATHLGVSFLKNALVKPFLVGKIIIDHPLGSARAGRDLIDARARQSVLRKLLHRDRKNVATHPFRIALRLSDFAGAVRSCAFCHDPSIRRAGGLRPHPYY